jgi:membrane protein DedA with SNARE-associated domain
MASWFLGLTDWITHVVNAIGYPGIFALMVIEGILTPIPSELIMPFAGYLASQGRLNIGLVIAVGTAGATIGNVVAYHIGAKVGRPLISRYGRFIRLGEDDLRWAESWFARYGSFGVLLGHAVPGIRSIISFPAGIGRMDLRRFVAFSTIGAAIWNTVLVVAGYYLVERWTLFAETTDNVDVYVLAAVFAVLIGYMAWRKTRAGTAKDRVAP